MKRLRILPLFSIVCLLSAPFLPAHTALAQRANGVQPQANNELVRDVENYWHYASIGRYDLARAEAQRVLQRSDEPVRVLEAFEQVSGERRVNLDEWLLRWQGVAEVREETTQLIQVLNQGYRARRADLQFIEENVRRLSGGERAYRIGIGRLRDSGELAVPVMIQHLRDPAQREHHSAIRRGLRDLGRAAMNPLLAATEMRDAETLTVVVTALGDIGYDVSVPYLARVVQDQRHPQAVHSAAVSALARMGAGDAEQMNAAELYYDLAERFYYNTAAVTADPRSPVAFVWYWNDQHGLVKRDVPPEIFNEIMSMRASEYVLKLDEARGDAVALWLAANYKREVELPSGASDPTRAERQPDAHYYGVSAGTQYLNSALARALRDREPAVALRVVQSLQEIVGQSNLFAEQQEQPLIDAMGFADRRVRFESAFALAAALPQQQFTGQERVVPILAEAVAQTGMPNVLVVVESQDRLNELVSGLQALGYGVAGGTSARMAISEAAALPAVDVLLISEELGAAEVEQANRLANQSPRLERSARVIMTRTSASPYAMWAAQDPLFTITQATEPQALQSAIEQARERSGALPLDEDLATDYAMRAADLLGRLAISRGQVLDLSAAEGTLLRALHDERREIVVAAGEVLGLLNSPQAQAALLDRAQDDRIRQEIRVDLYKSLATNAKFFGNRLDGGQVESLRQAVATAESLEVRSAAAEAHGALDLPADQARVLIVEQSKI